LPTTAEREVQPSCLSSSCSYLSSSVNDVAQQPPLASTVDREGRVQIAASHRAKQHGGGWSERTG